MTSYCDSSAATDKVRVMTFNVRQMDGEDGPQSWAHRKDILIETIRSRQPDLLGTQEIFAEQAAYILEQIPSLTCFGRGRYGDDRDKHNSIFYNRNMFSLVDSGEIWISLTPDIPGSSDWGIPRPRMITWGLLNNKNDRNLFVLNTHFPYGRDADEARRHTARLIIEKISTLPRYLPVLLTGDFNAAANQEIYALLTGDLQDAWTEAEVRSGPEGTVHGFGRFEGGRIDWVLYRNMGSVLSIETVCDTVDGLYPSDHFPVSTELKW
jgi:endonuclease/exonuclease/phosphatase family metal-dependent hydrolase